MKKCCGTCKNGEMYWRSERNNSNRVKRVRCGIDVPEVDFPPMPFWAEYELSYFLDNDNILPSEGKNCPCWKAK